MTNSLRTPQIAIEAMDKAGVDIAYQSHATYYTKQGLMEVGPRAAQIRAVIKSFPRVERVSRPHHRRFPKVASLPPGVLPLPDIDGCLKRSSHVLIARTGRFCLPGSFGGDISAFRMGSIHQDRIAARPIVHVHPAEPDWSLDLVDGVDAPNVGPGRCRGRDRDPARRQHRDEDPNIRRVSRTPVAASRAGRTDYQSEGHQQIARQRRSSR